MEFVAKLQLVDWHACADRDCEKLFFLIRPHGCTYIRERIEFHSKKQRFITSADRNEYFLKFFKHRLYFLSLWHVNRETIKINTIKLIIKLKIKTYIHMLEKYNQTYNIFFHVHDKTVFLSSTCNYQIWL